MIATIHFEGLSNENQKLLSSRNLPVLCNLMLNDAFYFVQNSKRKWKGFRGRDLKALSKFSTKTLSLFSTFITSFLKRNICHVYTDMHYY